VIDNVTNPGVAVRVAENETVAVHVVGFGVHGLFMKVAVTPAGNPGAEKVTGPLVDVVTVAVIDEERLVDP
jgi:hypothetical protein